MDSDAIRSKFPAEDAADELTRLRAENATLTESRDAAVGETARLSRQVAHYRTTAESADGLRARVAELERTSRQAAEYLRTASARVIRLESANAALRAGLLPWRPISECPDDGNDHRWAVFVNMNDPDGWFDMKATFVSSVRHSKKDWTHWMLARDFPLPVEVEGS